MPSVSVKPKPADNIDSTFPPQTVTSSNQLEPKINNSSKYLLKLVTLNCVSYLTINRISITEPFVVGIHLPSNKPVFDRPIHKRITESPTKTILRKKIKILQQKIRRQNKRIASLEDIINNGSTSKIPSPVSIKK